MVRAIVGVIVGWLVSVACVFIGLAAAWMVLGASFAYEEGTLNVTVGWCAIALGVGLVAAILAGLVTALIAPSPRRTPVKVLAVLILVLGLANAVGYAFVDRPDAEPSKPVEEMTMADAIRESVSPNWFNFANALVGFVGVLIGGGIRPRPSAE